MLERVFIGLFGGSVVSLLAVVAAAMSLGTRFELLASFDGYGAWAYLALWGAWAIVALPQARPVMAWRTMLYVSAGLLVLLPVLCGWAIHRADSNAPFLHDGFQRAMTLACVVLAFLLAALAALIGEHRVKRAQLARDASQSQHASGLVAAAGIAAALRRYAPFMLSAAAFVDGFRLAYLHPQDPLAGAGAIGMLLAFFLLLPGASIAAWLPRSAAGCLGTAAIAYSWLALLGRDPLWMLFACAALWFGWQSWERRHASMNAVRLPEAA